MKDSQERKEAWEADFKILMEKHNAVIRIINGFDIGTDTIEISMGGEWDRGGFVVVHPYTEFELKAKRGFYHGS